MLKYFLVLKLLLRLANFEAMGVIEKTIFNKITNKVQKEHRTKAINLIPYYFSLLVANMLFTVRISAYL